MKLPKLLCIIGLIGLNYLQAQNCADEYYAHQNEIFTRTQNKRKSTTWEAEGYRGKGDFAFDNNGLLFAITEVEIEGEKRKLRVFYEKNRVYGINEWLIKGVDEEELTYLTYFYSEEGKLLAIYDDAEGKSICKFEKEMMDNANVRLTIGKIMQQKSPK